MQAPVAVVVGLAVVVAVDPAADLLEQVQLELTEDPLVEVLVLQVEGQDWLDQVAQLLLQEEVPQPELGMV
jgi:hypothetical protein